MAKKKSVKTTKTRSPNKKGGKNVFNLLNRIAFYRTTHARLFLFFLLIFVIGIALGAFATKLYLAKPQPQVLSLVAQKQQYWFLLYRKSNIELLFKGVPNDVAKSTVVRVFRVKTGVPEKRPTPLPKLLGKKYWVITKKEESKESPETAPYFLTLNVPVTDEDPYGPTPYTECIDEITLEKSQCNWTIPGAFGLHGVSGDDSRLSDQDLGSSGCIRHKDDDITYLYNLLDPEKEEIRYYIEDV